MWNTILWNVKNFFVRLLGITVDMDNRIEDPRYEDWIKEELHLKAYGFPSWELVKIAFKTRYTHLVYDQDGWWYLAKKN